MKHLAVTLICVFVLPPVALSQSLTLKNKLELTVTKVERLTKWQSGAPFDQPVVARAGKEFVKLHLTARFPAGFSGDPCETRAGAYELVDASGSKVFGMSVSFALAEWNQRCKDFTVEFRESPVGVELTKLRLMGSEADISRVPGARGSGKK